MKNKRLIAAFALGGVLIAAGLAVAQVNPPPFVPNIHNTADAIQVVPNGVPSAQSLYATPAQITNVPGYVKITPATGATACTASPNNAAFCTGYNAAFANAQTYEIIVLTGTLAYNYTYTATAPSDGARECISGSGGAITQMTLLANGGSTVGTQVVTGGTNVSISSNSSACWTFSLSNLTWDRS